MARRLLALAAALAVATLGALAQAEPAAYDLQINTARVWLTTMEQLQARAAERLSVCCVVQRP